VVGYVPAEKGWKIEYDFVLEPDGAS